MPNEKIVNNEIIVVDNENIKKCICDKTNNKINVLFALSEANPFIKTGGLGDVGGSFPHYISKQNVDIRVVLPLYKTIKQKYVKNMKKVVENKVALAWRNLYFAIYEYTYNDIIYYFVDNEYYFGRENPYGYFDDGERFAFFSKALLEAIEYLDFDVQILHLNDWHTAVASVFLREMYQELPNFRKIKIVTTIHNIKFQGKFDKFVLGDILGFGGNEIAKRQLMEKDAVNYFRGGLNYTDFITTVSPSYAKEIKLPYYGEGLSDIFIRRNNILKGILNGIDYTVYNPQTDKMIYKNYDFETLDYKYENKLQFQQSFRLEVDKSIPIVSLISRLTEQKGLDLLINIFEELINTTSIQFVVLGIGDKKYEDAFRYFQNKYSGRVSINLYFSEELSRKIYAASDFILVPSKFEPCGLTQMIAMRYLTIPIVREVGGLKDTVLPYNKYTKEGNGFSFANYNAHELLFTIKEALNVYIDKQSFNEIIKHASKSDFSFEKSAKEHVKIYKKLLGR